MIVVKGVRRIGKSSLVNVGLRVAEKKLYTIFDARSIPELTIDNIYTVFEAELTRLITRASSLRTTILKFLEKVEGIKFSGVEVRLTRRRPKVVIEIVDALEKIAQEAGEPLILVFDEAQEFSILRGFNSLLAHIYDYYDHVKIILAGSEIGILDKLLGTTKPESPLYGRPYLEIYMRRLPYSSSKKFLEQGFQELGIEWPQNYIEDAVNKLDGIPGWLTYYGYYAYTTKNHREAVEKVLDEGSQLVRLEIEHFLAQRLQAKTRYKKILECLSIEPMKWSRLKLCLETAIGRRLNNSQYTRYLHELENYSFIEKEGEEYKLADPLIRYAVRKL